jgi:hypothetical protein
MAKRLARTTCLSASSLRICGGAGSHNALDISGVEVGHDMNGGRRS